MANSRYEEIAQMSSEDIMEQLEETKTKLNALTFNHAVSPIEDGTQIKRVKKHIARLMTELRKRELAES